jgi:hypothetical protein
MGGAYKVLVVKPERKNTLRVCENTVLRRIFGHKR